MRNIEKVKLNIVLQDTYLKKCDEEYLFYNDGYYYKTYFLDDCISTENILSTYYSQSFVSFTSKRLITCLHVNNEMYYDSYTYEELSKAYNEYFMIDSKEKLIEFYQSINSNNVIIDLEQEEIKLKLYNENIDLGFEVIIKFESDGIGIYGKI